MAAFGRVYLNEDGCCQRNLSSQELSEGICTRLWGSDSSVGCRYGSRVSMCRDRMIRIPPERKGASRVGTDSIQPELSQESQLRRRCASLR